MDWQTYSLLGMGAATVALTLTRSTLTKKFRAGYMTAGWFGELINCPYCMAHWSGALFSLYIRSGRSWAELGIDACIVTGLALLFIGVMLKLWLFQEAELDKYRDLIGQITSKLKEVKASKTEGQ